jgi:hypothetical protein
LVHLAPKAFMDEKQFTFKPGDRISANGRWADLNGQRCLIATQITDSQGHSLILRDGEGVAAWNGR